ncbi:MAG: MFS transporter [Hyphomonadaceae bacterium]|nr:MFS transporter [Hyphomonadaceae bacterium]
MPEAKPKLSAIQIWNMCVGFLGIQIGFDLQNGNVSRIFQTLGAEIDALPILWIAAPLTGLLVQPIIGYLSDHTWGRLGRRRPYFLVGAVLATLALIAMPNAPALWMAAGILWIMDAALNITMEPTRALVGDMLPDNQRTNGYAMQSFFIGAGAVLAGILPWILTRMGVANTAAPGVIPQTVHIAFYVGGATLFLAVIWTIITTREYPPDRLSAFESARRARAGASAPHVPSLERSVSAFLTGGLIWLAVGAAVAAIVWAARQHPRPAALNFLGATEFKQDLYVLAGLIAGFGVVQVVAGVLRASGRTANGYMEVVGDLFAMPQAMRQLAVVQFFTWFGLFAMWIYGAPAIAAHHFAATDAASAAYQEAGNWWGVLGSVRNGVAAIAALLIIVLATRVDRRLLHATCLVLGSGGFAAMMMIRDPNLLWAPMVGVGVAWAAIVSVPYAILASTVPARKMGVYMGIFNIFIVVPQLVAATLLGFLLRTFFGNEPIWAFAIAATSFAIAAIAVLLRTPSGGAAVY